MQAKILFVIKDHKGGVETFLKQIRNINRGRFKLYFVFFAKTALGKQGEKGLSLSGDHSNNQRLSLSKLWSLLRSIYHLLITVIKLKPDLIVSFPVFSMVSVGFVKLFFPKTKMVVVVNTNLEAIVNEKPGKFYHWLINILIKYSISIYSKVIFASVDLFKNTHERYWLDKSRCQVIEHSVDLKMIKIKQSYKLSIHDMQILKKKGVKVFSVGRLEGQKDFWTIVRAFKEIQKSVEESQLIIIGDGSEKEKLEDLAFRLGISKNVHFLGWKKNIYKYLRYADIFILSSKFEGFGMVLVEAMAAGVPVVSTNTPFGPREILGGGKYGVLVPRGDFRKMSSAVLKLIRDKHLRIKYRKSGILRAKKYDTKIMLEKFEKLFLRLTENRSNYG